MADSIDVHDQAAYDALQAKLIPLWKSIERLNTDEQTIVVVPSAHIDVELAASLLQAYEERYLFLLFLLRQPRARMIYVTGQAIHPDIIDYYLGLIPGVVRSHVRSRLFFVSPMEATYRALADKLLDRPRLISRIRDLIVDRYRAHLVPFMTTWSDRELAMRLGIPMYGADPKDVHFGTKSAGRKLFAQASISHPAGREDLHSRDDVVAAVLELYDESPDTDRVIVKHNEGVSGFGNAIVDLTGLPHGTDRSKAINERIGSMRLNEHAGTIEDYFDTMAIEGGIVETMIQGEDLPSPSVQMRITPLGDVEVLSTHDQILGGVQISRSARKVGELLAEEGIIGRFAIDFMMTHTQDGWQDHAIELNLRKGGTTHPFLTLQFLTDGAYDEASGHFLAPSGKRKFYVASDHVEIEGLDRFTPQDLIDIALMHELHFNQATQTGSVFSMLSALATHGFVGVTSVGDSPAEAQDRYDAVVSTLTKEAEAAG